MSIRVQSSLDLNVEPFNYMIFFMLVKWIICDELLDVGHNTYMLSLTTS